MIEGEDTEVNASVSNLIDVLHKAHRDNERRDYYARSNGRSINIMPVTPFVFEFFIYNSIYQVNWPDSLKYGRVVKHPRKNSSEGTQQKKLETFLKPYVWEEPALLYQAFSLIRDTSLEGDWTTVVPDERISKEDGQKFFERLGELHEILGGVDRPEGLQMSNKILDLIKHCRYYVYSIRCNIFHGSKTLGETYEPNQKKRIELYLTFIRCLNRLFFSVCNGIREGRLTVS